MEQFTKLRMGDESHPLASCNLDATIFSDVSMLRWNHEKMLEVDVHDNELHPASLTDLSAT